MKAYKKQIEKSRVVEPVSAPTKEPVKPAKDLTTGQEARVSFMRNIVANSRARM